MKTNRWRNRILWMAFLVCLVLIFCLTAFHRPILSGKESEAAAIRSTKLFLLQSQPFPDSGNRYMQGRAMLPRHAIWI